MKPLNETELSQLVEWMRPRVEGARLQDIWSEGDGLILEIYRQGVQQIYLDLKPGRGFLVLWSEGDLVKRRSSTRPLSLFLNSHAKNLELVEIRMVPGLGRAFEIEFSSADGEKSCCLRVILIPNAVNAVAESGGKKIAWMKPRDLEVRTEEREFPVRWQDWQLYIQEYRDFRAGARADKAPEAGKDSATTDLDSQRLKQWRKDLEKKRGVIEQLRSTLTSDEDEQWRSFGESLKMGRARPEEKFWDAKLSLAENRERAFRKSKDLHAKKEGTARRLDVLKQEILQLEAWIASPATAPVSPPKKGRGSQVLERSESKGRTLNLPSGLQAILGRSAKDNLAILRQARAWDLWIHLKDEPSAHAIIFREKNQNVSREDIEAVAQWILRSGSGQKLHLNGLRFEVVCVECRFVRPIKGDRLGRVNYHSPVVYSFASKSAGS